MLVIALALAAAGMNAVSSAGEQRAASRLAAARHRRGHTAGLVLALLTTPLWLGSWVLDSAGFFVQAAALHLGSLTVVQPLMVTTLLFSLPLAAAGTGRWPTAVDWTGALLICTGLVAVLATRGGPGAETAPTPTLLAAMGAVAMVAVLLVVLAQGRRPQVRAGLLAAAAGALFGVGAALTKLTAGTATDGGFLGLLTGWPGYALALVSVTSFGLQQAAFTSGPLAPAVAATVITDPLASYVIGVAGLGEPMPRVGGPLALAVAGMGVLAAGVVVLARSPLLHPLPVTRPRPATEPPALDARAEAVLGGTAADRCCASGV